MEHLVRHTPQHPTCIPGPAMGRHGGSGVLVRFIYDGCSRATFMGSGKGQWTKPRLRPSRRPTVGATGSLRPESECWRRSGRGNGCGQGRPAPGRWARSHVGIGQGIGVSSPWAEHKGLPARSMGEPSNGTSIRVYMPISNSFQFLRSKVSTSAPPHRNISDRFWYGLPRTLHCTFIATSSPGWAWSICR